MTADPLTLDDFTFVAAFVHDRAAIVLDASKEYLVQARLRPLVRQFECDSIHALIACLRERPTRELEQAVVEALTTNETHFFRDTAFYEVLRDGVLPRLIAARRASRRLTMWCAACSSGQEPYSVLMLIHEHFPEILGWNFKFIVSDISQEMLERTRDGRYTQHETNRGLPAQLLTKYLDRDGIKWQMKPNFRKLLDVREVNLAKAWAPMPPIDIVFMRNVLIYFGVDTKREILARVGKVMSPDGLLFLGGSETLFGIDDTFRRSEFGKASCYGLAKVPVSP